MELYRETSPPTESVVRWNFELEHSGADLSKSCIFILLGKYVTRVK
jgi:hypothetical protein